MARETELTDVTKTMQVLEVVPTKWTRGKRVAFTGHLSVTRDEYAKILADAGMIFEKSVVWGTNILVTNRDWNSGAVDGGKSNKLRKAESMGVKIMNEEQFHDLLVKKDTP